VEERVVRVETEVIGLDRRLGRLEDAVKDVRADVKEFRLDMNGRLVSFESKLDGRLLSLESKMDRQFHWLVGLMFSALVAVVIALVRR
jgi:hypothetical protein